MDATLYPPIPHQSAVDEAEQIAEINKRMCEIASCIIGNAWNACLWASSIAGGGLAGRLVSEENPVAGVIIGVIVGCLFSACVLTQYGCGNKCGLDNSR